MQRIWWLWGLPCVLASSTWCQLAKNDFCKGQRHSLTTTGLAPRRQSCPWREAHSSVNTEYFSALVDFVDWDRDGYMDVLEAQGSWSWKECEIVWFKPITPTYFERVSLLNWTAPLDHFAAVDWNQDGFMDLLVCSEHVISFVDGQDSFRLTHEIIRNVSSCKFLKAVDFDSDGDSDLIVDNRYFERMSEFEVKEREGKDNPLQIVENHQLWAVEDWDNDGDLDLVVEHSGDGEFSLMEQLSDGTFREPRENPFHSVYSIESRYTAYERNYLADLNGDGLLDLWQMGAWNDCNYVYERAHVRDKVLVEQSMSENPTNPFLDLDILGDEVHYVDWNQDGLMDLLLSRAQCNGVDWWDLVAFSMSSGRRCYDRDADGPAIRYFQGQEDGSLKESFGVFDDVHAGDRCRISVADWDGDGDPDLILISGVNISFYQNQGGKPVLSNDFALSQIDGLVLRLFIPADSLYLLSQLNYEGESGVVPAQPIAVDWDDDGFTDLILAPQGQFFRRTDSGLNEDGSRQTSLIEVPTEENPFRSLPTRAADDLQWRLLDCDGDGDLDLIRLNQSQQLEACERQGDALNCSSSFRCLEWNEGRPKIYSFDVWREDSRVSVLGTPVSKDRRAQFWSQGFCLPSLQCSGHGRCRNLRGVCECVRGHDLDDCSGCQAGFASVGPDGCQACATDQRGVTCSGRGICRDDHFARRQPNVSNSTRPLMRGDGSCLCNEDTFGGEDATGKVNCESGRCKDGFEEVQAVELASSHCQPCPAGSSSVNGTPCSQCLPGTAAGIGSAACESCEAGRFSATVGNSQCSLCQAGTYAAAGSNECGRCQPGSYSGSGATNCTLCQEGWVAEDWGSPICELCLAGTYAHEGRVCRNCPSNSISTFGRTECEPCVGSFLPAYADAQRLTCHASMLNLFFGVAMGLCLTAALTFTLWLCFYQLHIEDLGLQGDAIVVTTSRPHRILHWQRSKASIILRNTGNDPLEKLQTRSCYRAKALSGRDLQLIHAESVGPWDTTIGSLRVHLSSALLHTGFLRIPFLLWLILLLILVVLLGRQLLLRMLLLVVAIALISSLTLCLCFHRMSSRTPMAEKQRRFKEQLQEVQKSRLLKSCPSGPERAITIGQIGRLFEFFQSFIKDRSMYYICSNLVIPLTEGCKLSYAELVGPRQVNWFVSHYWGTPFQEFLTAVRHHAKSDGAVEWQSTAYWICTFSNNQWEVEAELGHGDWRKSSFYKSLRSESCQGTVMVLDEQALPLRRAWCLFEVLQTKFISTERASSFQGLLLCTSCGVLRNGQGGIDIAMAVANCLATLDLKDARASDPKDEVMIRSLVERMPGGFHATNAFVRKTIRDCLLVAHENFEADYGKLLTILNSSLPTEDAAGALPTLLTSPAPGNAVEMKNRTS